MKEPKQRTISMNRALHLMFTQVSTTLVEQGIDQRMILNNLKGYETPVTPEFLKTVFKTIAYTMYRKESTTTLTTNEMTTCFDVFAKFLGEEYGLTVSWPSQDSLALQALIDNEQQYGTK